MRLEFIAKGSEEASGGSKEEKAGLKILSGDQLKELQQIQLMILDDIIAICRRYQISYMLIAGSAIGALRGGEFIPWDDDIDIAMPRREFEKFVRVVRKHWSDKYSVIHPQDPDKNSEVSKNAANTENTEQPRQAAPQQPQIIKVPQLAGYDSNNQPVYKYIQMKLAGYDQKGQPVYVPLQAARPQQAAAPAQQAAAPRPQAQPQQAAAPAQQTAAQAQRAAAAPVQPAVQPQQTAPVQPAPVHSPVPKKPVQQSGVPKANISQIAVNPHSKQTSQAFINAIASSKEYADKNLIDTQGLKANSPVLTSVEDVLSTMGDDSAKRQKAVQAQQAVPVFEEYKSPARNTYRGGGSSPKMHQPLEKDARYMTKSELKAKKKQDKIDAKFKKEMSKRGF